MQQFLPTIFLMLCARASIAAPSAVDEQGPWCIETYAAGGYTSGLLIDLIDANTATVADCALWVFQSGINDADWWGSNSDNMVGIVRAQYDHLKLRANAAGSEVFMQEVQPCDIMQTAYLEKAGWPKFQTRLGRIRHEARRYAREAGWGYIDTVYEMEGWLDDATAPLTGADGVHLTEAGAEKLADLIWAGIRQRSLELRPQLGVVRIALFGDSIYSQTAIGTRLLRRAMGDTQMSGITGSWLYE